MKSRYQRSDQTPVGGWRISLDLWPANWAIGLWIEFAYNPPWWVHAVTTLPAILILCVLPLRFLKGALVASQYVNKAEEARFTTEPRKPA